MKRTMVAIVALAMTFIVGCCGHKSPNVAEAEKDLRDNRDRKLAAEIRLAAKKEALLANRAEDAEDAFDSGKSIAEAPAPTHTPTPHSATPTPTTARPATPVAPAPASRPRFLASTTVAETAETIEELQAQLGSLQIRRRQTELSLGIMREHVNDSRDPDVRKWRRAQIKEFEIGLSEMKANEARLTRQLAERG